MHGQGGFGTKALGRLPAGHLRSCIEQVLAVKQVTAVKQVIAVKRL